MFSQAIASNPGNARRCWLAWPASWAFPFLGVPAGETPTLSPEAQAKAKETFKKRFDNSGEKTRAARLRDEIIHSSSSGGPPP